MMTNARALGEASFKATIEEEFAAFDKLPKRVRQALREAEMQWSAAAILQTKRRFKMRVPEVLERIRANDRTARERTLRDAFPSSFPS